MAEDYNLDRIRIILGTANDLRARARARRAFGIFADRQRDEELVAVRS
jgi:hypothetical protein